MEIKTFDDYKKLSMGGKYRRTICLPDIKLRLDIKVLTSGELMESDVMKTSYLKSKDLTDHSDAARIEAQAQISYRCCYEEGANKKFFATILEAREFPDPYLQLIADQHLLLNAELYGKQDLSVTEIEDVKKKLKRGEVPIELSYSQLLQMLMVLGEFQSTLISESEQSLDVDQKNLQKDSGLSTVSSLDQSTKIMPKKLEVQKVEIEIS